MSDSPDLTTTVPEELEVPDDGDFDGAGRPQIKNYRIVEQLASGGMAALWLSRRLGASRLCVIKVLHEALAEDSELARRFVREAEVASLLDHESIAKISDAGRSGGKFYIAMDYVPGIDASAILKGLSRRGEVLPVSVSLSLVERVLGALHYAHEFRDAAGEHLKIVHRDVSPKNVMVTFDGDVQLIDFGIARARIGDFRTTPGALAGTLQYMSPEQIKTEPVDARCDVYATGAVLFECLTGQRLVQGQDYRDVLGAIIYRKPESVRAMNPEVPQSVQNVVEKALAKAPEDRYQTALAFQTALVIAAQEVSVASSDEVGRFLQERFPLEWAASRAVLHESDHGEGVATPDVPRTKIATPAGAEEAPTNLDTPVPKELNPRLLELRPARGPAGPVFVPTAKPSPTDAAIAKKRRPVLTAVLVVWSLIVLGFLVRSGITNRQGRRAAANEVAPASPVAAPANPRPGSTPEVPKTVPGAAPRTVPGAAAKTVRGAAPRDPMDTRDLPSSAARKPRPRSAKRRRRVSPAEGQGTANSDPQALEREQEARARRLRADLKETLAAVRSIENPDVSSRDYLRCTSWGIQINSGTSIERVEAVLAQCRRFLKTASKRP